MGLRTALGLRKKRRDEAPETPTPAKIALASSKPRPMLNGRTIFKDRSNAIYQILKHYPPGLMVDAGAAAGHMTGLMLRASPTSRVHAFEPFPGNFKFFNEHIGDDPRVTLDKRAVSDAPGKANFLVPSSVAGTEAGWENMKGYSSLGMLGAPKEGQVSITVECCRIDDVVNEQVRFLKIDTQGAESKVLRGCSKLFDKDMIDIMFVEFDGKNDVIQIILDHGFTIIGTECVLVVETGEKPDKWDVIREGVLSTGLKSLKAWPKQHISDPYDYSQFLRDERKLLGKTWTDLVCVSKSALPWFMYAAGKRDQEVGPQQAFSVKGPLSDIL